MTVLTPGISSNPADPNTIALTTPRFVSYDPANQARVMFTDDTMAGWFDPFSGSTRRLAGNPSVAGLVDGNALTVAEFESPSWAMYVAPGNFALISDQVRAQPAFSLCLTS